MGKYVRCTFGQTDWAHATAMICACADELNLRNGNWLMMMIGSSLLYEMTQYGFWDLRNIMYFFGCGRLACTGTVTGAKTSPRCSVLTPVVVGQSI